MKSGRIIALIFLLLLLTGCGFNILGYTIFYEEEPEEPIEKLTGVQIGNLISINYVLSIKENGKIVDTNDKKIAEENNIKNYVNGPFKFILGKSGKVKGFDNAIIGMEINEKKTSTIKPSVEPKEETIELTEYVKRKIEMPRFIVITKKTFEKTFHKPPVLDLIAVARDAPWPYKVITITDTKVGLEVIVEEGDDVMIPGQEWKSKVLALKPKSMILVQNPKEGQEVTTDYGTAVIEIAPSNIVYHHTPELDKEFDNSVSVGRSFSSPERFFVKEINEESFVIRKANYLEQEELELEVELLEITELE